MKRVEFARLAGISAPMVTKYAEDGLIKFSAPKIVDARATLAALEGRLDEGKRRNALAELEMRAAAAQAAPEAPAVDLFAPAPAPNPEPARSAKAELDDIKRQREALELGKAAGALCVVEDVEARAIGAVTAMRNSYAMQRRSTAEAIVRSLGVDLDRVGGVERELARGEARVLGSFRDAMRVSEDEASQMAAG